MKELVNIMDGKPMVSSRDVAEKFGKNHAEVMTAANNLILELETHSAILLSEFFVRSTYKTDRGREYKNILMTRDGFSLLAMGFTGKKFLQWKIQYIEAFNKMEAFISNEQQDFASQINKVSEKIDDLAEAGSAWGKTGHAIRKEKANAIEELARLIDHAQMQLDFKPSGSESSSKTPALLSEQA